MLSEREMRAVLDKFPAFQLHNTLLLVGVLLPMVEAALQQGTRLNSISTKELASSKLRPTEIRDAVKVLASVHERMYPKPVKGLGVAAAHIPAPRYTPTSLENFAYLPLAAVFDELKKREGSYKEEKPRIRITGTGLIYYLEGKKPDCDLSQSEVKYLRFFVSQPKPVSLKRIAQATGTQSSNVSRDIRLLNEKTRKKLKLPFPLIGKGRLAGFFLNRERYTIESSSF